jgi:hypothetical protein
MMNAGSRNTILGIAGALALVGLASGCTAGVLVDENFNKITDWRTGGASVTFQTLGPGPDFLPTGKDYSFNLNGQPYISFDAFADDGATSSDYPGLVNSAQLIPQTNYRVEFFQRTVGFARSHRFAHNYTNPGSCKDAFTGNTDGDCAVYYFELNYHCPVCTGPNCGGIQPLPTQNGIPVIEMCVSNP